jgi:hypothetical protein
VVCPLDLSACSEHVAAKVELPRAYVLEELKLYTVLVA